jgi:hypothetical protein
MSRLVTKGPLDPSGGWFDWLIARILLREMGSLLVARS